MNDITKVIIGTIATIVIGGVAYNINQSDIIKNFADDTGLTQEEAEQYINKVQEESLVSWHEGGSELIEFGQEILSYLPDCENYSYEWETTTLSCSKGKEQMDKIARDNISLGQAYKKLDTESASKYDVQKTITLIDQLTGSFEFEIFAFIFTQSEIDEMKKTNSYNKALLKTVLEAMEE
jgi:hypothetical protein